jgi:large subunit ribosomal protein L4e
MTASKVPVFSAAGEKTARHVELPAQFHEEIRPDVIGRAVLSAQANRRQAYGPDKESGQRSSARYKGTRKGWGHSYSYGQARIPRLMIKKGGRRVGQAKIVPQTVGGRSVHAPMPEKNYSEGINKKERQLAIRSAISATTFPELVSGRGHRIPKEIHLPIIVEKTVEEMKKAKELFALFEKLGLGLDLIRASIRETRPGKGKMRGRPYKTKKSVLLVLAGKSKAAANIPGVDVVEVTRLNAELLAPGAKPGRLTVWSEAAIEKMREEKLYGI